MKYFEQFNIVNINDQKLRDLFFKVYVDNIETNQIVNYELSDYETIKDVAYNFYGETSLWWIIALLNNVYDINFDWVLTNEQIENIASEKVIELGGDFLTYFDELRTSSDEKRVIKLLKKEFLTNFLNAFLDKKVDVDVEIADTDLEEYTDDILDDINYKAIRGTLYDVSLPLCGNEDLNVFNVRVINTLSNITILWDLPPNNGDYQGIWIVDNGISIALLSSSTQAYTIQTADIGAHEIHIILVQKNKGVEVRADVFVALPSISVIVNPVYFQDVYMSMQPGVTGGYGTITWDCLVNTNYLEFYPSTPLLSGIISEPDIQRVTFIATDSAGRFDRKRVDLPVSGFPQLSYDVDDNYDQFDIFNLEPILTYGYGRRVYTLIGTLPTGLSMDSDGVISGQVLTYGSFEITIQMVDEVNRETSYTFNLIIDEVPPIVISFTLEDDYMRTRAISIVPTTSV